MIKLLDDNNQRGLPQFAFRSKRFSADMMSKRRLKRFFNQAVVAKVSLLGKTAVLVCFRLGQISLDRPADFTPIRFGQVIQKNTRFGALKSGPRVEHQDFTSSSPSVSPPFTAT